MSMLTGLITPTAGTAYIDGKDIRYNIAGARDSLGLCPQHNVLFDELTVEEHFRFFCRLKGVVDPQEIANNSNKYIAMLEMEDKRHTLTNKLSGGMKRKLSIGIALCGNSKTVICDEPTSGLDSAGRRALWDLLIEEKKNRTILLTTHYMDEADVSGNSKFLKLFYGKDFLQILGDRIAIMTDGELKTVGSSFFLKKRFGTGYKLICEKVIGCDTRRLYELLKSFVPNVKMETDSQQEVSFVIGEENLPRFHEIFKILEDNSESLKVSSFGCSLTTMEEVFLKIGSDAYDKTNKNGFTIDDEKEIAEISETIVDLETVSKPTKVTGVNLAIYQCEAIILKKFFYLRRNYAPIIWYGFLSFWLIYVILAESVVNFTSIDSMNISMGEYKETTTVLAEHKPNET